MDTLGDSIAIQRVSWRKPRAVDFRSIQGAIAADGLGNLLSGLAGTVPNTTYAASISTAELTGVASRSVGVCVGIVFATLAFLPKFLAVIIATPGPVVAAYYVVLMALLFIFGMKVLLRDGLDYRKGLIVGRGVLDRNGIPDGLDLSGVLPGKVERIAGQRYDRGRLRGDTAVHVPRAYRGPPASPPGRIGRRRRRKDRRVPCELCREPRLGRTDGPASPGGRRRDAPFAPSRGARPD